MQINQENAQGHQINAYDRYSITIDEAVYTDSLIVASQRLICPWTDKPFNQLTDADFTALIELKPRIAIIGTGSEQRHPSPRLMMLFHQHQIGLECMSTAAACRTYNVLAAEGRDVVAGLILNSA